MEIKYPNGATLIVDNLPALAKHLLDAKREEAVARARRIVIEEDIAELIPGPDKGQKTVTLEDGTKIVVERGWNYKADCQKIIELCKPTTENGNAIIIPPIKSKTTIELDEKGYEYYRESSPHFFSQLSQYVEVKPKKVAVSIKVKA